MKPVDQFINEGRVGWWRREPRREQPALDLPDADLLFNAALAQCGACWSWYTRVGGEKRCPRCRMLNRPLR